MLIQKHYFTNFPDHHLLPPLQAVFPKLEMKTAVGGLTDDGSNTILYTTQMFCCSWQEVGAWLILALLHQSAGKNWNTIAHHQLHHKGQVSAWHSPAVSYAPTARAGCLMLLLTHRQSRLNVPLKTTSYSRCLSYMHSCKLSPPLSSHLTDCRKCTELQVCVTSYQKLLCCRHPRASNWTVFAVTGQPLLWSSAHTEPNILSVLWSPFTVFKWIYSQFTWIKIRPQALVWIYSETLYTGGTCILCKS